MDNSIVEKIIKEIEHFAPAHESEHVGRVTAVGDGVVAIDGLSKAVMSEVLLFEEKNGKKLGETMDASGSLSSASANLRNSLATCPAVVMGCSSLSIHRVGHLFQLVNAYFCLQCVFCLHEMESVKY